MAKIVVEDYAYSASWDFDPTRPAPSKWVLPPPRIHKVNVDGASSKQDNFSSVGLAIRDSNGQVVAALCLPLQSYYSAELTEIFALEQGVLLAQEL
uniref:RNase H type-1 domain-containing protein n=1 Tax=Quercus lobata TaxID=97700 RepID=A0A7N2MDW6_QUELO